MIRLGFLLGAAFITTLLNAGMPGKHRQRWESATQPKAVKIMETELSRGKNLQQAFELVIKEKAFDGSKACITFIREEAMKSRESAPLIFKKLWLE
jgi:Flp pilus assembly protein TadB